MSTSQRNVRATGTRERWPYTVVMTCLDRTLGRCAPRSAPVLLTLVALACLSAPVSAQTPTADAAADPTATVEAAPADAQAPADADLAVPIPPVTQPEPYADEVSGELQDLGKILRRVWNTHPEVDVVRSELDAVKFDISGAKSGYYPYAQLQSAVAQKQDDGSSTLSLVQPLWDGGLTRSQVQQARARESVSNHRLSSVRLELSEQVLTAYFDILGSKTQVGIWDGYLAQLQSSLQTITRRAGQGVAPDADVQTAVTRVRQAEAGREGAIALGYSAQARLASLLSAPAPALRWPSETTLLAPDELGVIENKLDQHPALRVNRAEVEVQKATAAAARASVWPVISLQHREQIDGVRFDPSSNATLLVMQYQSANGFKAYRGAQAEVARIESTTRRADATRAALKADLEADKAQLIALAQQLKAQDAAARSSGGLVESYLRQFDVGRKTWVELLNAQREAHDSQLQAALLRRAYWQTNSRLVLQSLRWDKLQLAEFLPDAPPLDAPTAATPATPVEIPPAPSAP